MLTTTSANSNENVEPRCSKRTKTESFFRPNFVTIFLTKGGEINDLDDLNENFVQVSILEDDRRTYKEAMSSIDSKFRKDAIHDELESIMSNCTWILTDLLKGCNPLSNKRVFKRKLKAD